MRNVKRWAVVAWQSTLLAASAVMLGGCWGVHTVPEVDPSTAQSRIEAEVIDRAELVRQDTPPYHHGRHAYRRGADRVLVLTRITSFAHRQGEDKNAPVVRKDTNFERAWIAIPLGTPIGQPLDLEQLSQDFLTGYDVKKPTATEQNPDFFIFPGTIRGRLTVVEERPDALVLDLNLVVHPEAEPWAVRERMTVPMGMDGRWAQIAPPDASVWASKRRATVYTYEPPRPSPTEVPPQAPASVETAPESVVTNPPAAPEPAAAPAAPTPAAQPQSNAPPATPSW